LSCRGGIARLRDLACHLGLLNLNYFTMNADLSWRGNSGDGWDCSAPTTLYIASGNRTNTLSAEELIFTPGPRTGVVRLFSSDGDQV